MNRDIFHKGRIVSVTPQTTTVEIISESACSSCHAKGLCGLGESRTKAVQLPTSGWDGYREGDEVTLVLKASMGHKAVWIAYVIPLFVLMAVLLAMLLSGVGELASGLAAISAIAVYYLAVWLLRNKLKNEYIFNIKK